jgi:hypothetical protein
LPPPDFPCHGQACDENIGNPRLLLGIILLYNREHRNWEEVARRLTSTRWMVTGDAAFHLAVAYERGCGVAADMKSAELLYLQAAKSMDGEWAAYSPWLPIRSVAEGICYERGYGDFEGGIAGAIECYRRDEKRSAYQLAQCYEHGRGVDKNLTESLRLYRWAAEWDCYADRDVERLGTEPGASRGCSSSCRTDSCSVRRCVFVQNGAPSLARCSSECHRPRRGLRRIRSICAE